MLIILASIFICLSVIYNIKQKSVAYGKYHKIYLWVVLISGAIMGINIYYSYATDEMGGIMYAVTAGFLFWLVFLPSLIGLIACTIKKRKSQIKY